jgi:hypothetical protein
MSVDTKRQAKDRAPGKVHSTFTGDSYNTDQAGGPRAASNATTSQRQQQRTVSLKGLAGPGTRLENSKTVL